MLPAGGVPFQLQLPRANDSSAVAAPSSQPHLGPGCYDPSYSLVQSTLARLLLPFHTSSQHNRSIASQLQADEKGKQQPQEGDVLGLNVAAALQAMQPRKAAHSTVHMRVMLGREEAAAALSALAAAAEGFGGASGLGFGKLTSQLPLPDADLDAALRRRLPDVIGFVSDSSGHGGEMKGGGDQLMTLCRCIYCMILERD
jgi:hypothetical protein